MRIALGSDHAGFPLKALVAEHLAGKGHEIIDVGTDSEEPVDYPEFCAAAARTVTRAEADLAIVFGGSGQGEQIAANKVHGIRAALCVNEWMARMARRHNDANVLALGARNLGTELAVSIVDAFLAEGFDGGRHERRVKQIADLEEEECGS
jgi:ribose 5-phosphate isomerase B